MNATYLFKDPKIELRESCKLHLKLSAMLIKKSIGNLIENKVITNADECLAGIMKVLDKMRDIINKEDAQVLIEIPNVPANGQRIDPIDIPHDSNDDNDYPPQDYVRLIESVNVFVIII